MKILFDICHLPQLNFFKPALLKLGPDKVDITCVNRGKLISVIKNELPRYNYFVFGDYKYNTTSFSTIFNIIIPRFFQLFNHISRSNYFLVVSAASAYQLSLVSFLKGIPSIGFNDDPRKLTFNIAKYFSNDFYIPSFKYTTNDASRFYALKEWSYLSPDFFTPSNYVLDEYGLASGKYVFIRDVSTRTLNYKHQTENKIQLLSSKLTDRIVLSLENKDARHLYPRDWIVLEEPVSDIHSLMFYSKFVISTGDSMAREGGMLGVTSIYLGEREMPANQMLANEGILHKLDCLKFLDLYQNDPGFFIRTESQKNQFRQYLHGKWDNVTQLILSLVDKYSF